jgi:hypothetical protein
MKRREFVTYGSAVCLASSLSVGKAKAADYTALSGSYETGFAVQIPFGYTSFFISPWRAYMDTWPSGRFKNVLGVGFGSVLREEAQATAQVLSESGIRSARIEVPWSLLRYDDPSQFLPNAIDYLNSVLLAFKTYGIRPLILLNGNSGLPCPQQGLAVNLLANAAVDATEIYIDNVTNIRLGYTGITNQAYQTAFPLITACDPATGRCTLSAPLLKPLTQGTLQLVTLKYQPFSGFIFTDGTPNPAGQDTLNGWASYAVAVCQFASGILGTSADAGFDLEVWNELFFGSEFLYDSSYYNPPRQYSQPLQYSNYGLTWQADTGKVLMAVTVDAINGNYPGTSKVFPKVNVIWGAYSNQTPWARGADMWPGQAGFSRHYYTGIVPGKWTGGESGTLDPADPPNIFTAFVIDALGANESPTFIPAHTQNMPEFWHFGYKRESITRDIQPWPSGFNSYDSNPAYYRDHFRFSHSGNGNVAQVWMTETNFDRTKWSQSLIEKTGVSATDTRLLSLLNTLGAKALLRQYIFFAHKGLFTVNIFNLKDNDLSVGVLPAAFFTALAASNYQLDSTVRAQIGPQLTVIKQAVAKFKQPKTLDSPRKLTVSQLVEYSPRLVYAGDGTPNHPSWYNRNDFACLPFQTDYGSFTIAYYVVTRNLIQEWQTSYDVLDPKRYNMPEQTFDLTLQNVRGQLAKVQVYDPVLNKNLKATIVSSTASTLTVSLPTVDYPRFLLLTEATSGPQFIAPKLSRNSDGSVRASFKSNIAGQVQVSWGAVPARNNRGLKTLTVAANVLTNVDIPATALQAGDGVLLKLTSTDNVVWVNWPLWGHDVKGQIDYIPT